MGRIGIRLNDSSRLSRGDVQSVVNCAAEKE